MGLVLVKDRFLCIAITLFFFVIYGLTLCPTVFWYDSAEYTAASLTLGIAHPPGYPLYTMLGYAFSRLFPHPDAYAINLMSAFFMSIAIGLFFQILRVLSLSKQAAIFGCLLLGTTGLIWSQSIVAEVYTLALAANFLILWLLLKSHYSERKVYWLWAAFVGGLSFGLHYSVATCGIGFLILFFKKAKPPKELIRKILLSLFFFGLGLTNLVYLPLRAAMHPAVDTFKPESFQRWIWMLSGGYYRLNYGYLSLGDAMKRLAFLLYDELLVVGLILACLGIVSFWRKERRLSIALFAMAFGNSASFFFYNVHDAAVFFIPTLSILILYAALGFEMIREILPLWIEKKIIAYLMVGVLFLFPLSQLIVNWSKNDLSNYRAAYQYGDYLTKVLPKQAVLIHYGRPADWKNTTVFSMYFQHVLKKRQDVEVIDSPPKALIARRLKQKRKVYAFVKTDVIEKHYRGKRVGKIYQVLAIK